MTGEQVTTEQRLEEPLALTVMRGGTSRGPVVRLADLPGEGAERDRIVLSLIGRGRSQLDGLGGGTPTTSKVVLVSETSEHPDADVDYLVANVVVGKDLVDYTGTCGNMTATVQLYLASQGLRPASGTCVLRNLSTGQLIRSDLLDPPTAGDDVRVRTEYLDPGASILDRVLPTGHPLDLIAIAGGEFRASVVDVAHPYLFLDESEVLQAASGEPGELVEQIRGEVSRLLGFVNDASDAANVAPSVPRVILVRGFPEPEVLEVQAYSMGHPVDIVPVTSALCAAAAIQIPGTLLHEARPKGVQRDPRLRVRAAASEVIVQADVDANGAVHSAAVERTARIILDGVVRL